MGWFNEQIRYREQAEKAMCRDVEAHLEGAATGRYAFEHFGQSEQTIRAVELVLSYYGKSLPGEMRDIDSEEDIDYVFRANDIMLRHVDLEQNWHRVMFAPVIALTEDGSPVALIPGKTGGYTYTDPNTGKKLAVGKANADGFQKEAITFYRAFPNGKLGKMDLYAFTRSLIKGADVLTVGVLTLLATLFAAITPWISGQMIHLLSASGDPGRATALYAGLIAAALLFGAMTMLKNLVTIRISNKVTIPLQAACMIRLLSLKSADVKKTAAGNMSKRILQIGRIGNSLVNAVFSAGLTCVFSLVYMVVIFQDSYFLGRVVETIVLALVLLHAFALVYQVRISRDKMSFDTQSAGITYRFIEGMRKIGISGAGNRAFARWAHYFNPFAKISYNPPIFLKTYSVVVDFIILLGMILLFCMTTQAGEDASSFFLFLVAYGMITQALRDFINQSMALADQVPYLLDLAPLLEQIPEIDEDKARVRELNGDISIDRVSYHYPGSEREVLKGLSLEVKPGEYVAILGSSGCGKSTIVRLLLGFDTPQAGEIFYDGRPLKNLDLKSLRKNIGVVLQNGNLFAGTIFQNITINAPDATEEEAWWAAELAGIASDIRKFPLQMKTPVPADGRGVSGGQMQRLMIARAIAGKPKILIMDEATSALDNVVQKKVSDALDDMNCTRIVIAHRLSTVENCDRIFVMGDGRIAEAGTYEELMEKKGQFFKLVERQQL